MKAGRAGLTHATDENLKAWYEKSALWSAVSALPQRIAELSPMLSSKPGTRLKQFSDPSNSLEACFFWSSA